MTNTDESAQTLPTAPASELQDQPADLMLYVATVNVPGYSPMADEPAVFATAEAAWSYLADERERSEDEDDDADDYSDVREMLALLAEPTASAERIAGVTMMVNAERVGTVYGATPGYDGDHDLGLAYSVATDDTLVRAADAVMRGYAEAMLWANACCAVEDCSGRESGDCEHSNGAHNRFSLDDFSDDDVTRMRVDVHAMILGADENGADFLAYCDARPILGGAAATYFGHDFALTRNGHGAGYWDRGIGALGVKLTEWAKTFGDSHVNVNEDGVTVE